jgi:2-polyprenyl-3-methyl-5-hydroxy-6-metoxy-1,4-benzoquinol methylase
MMKYVEKKITKELWPEIDTSDWIITGNMAKVKVLHKLLALISNGSGLSVLDIGCVGPQPLDFWEPLLVHHGSRFHLSGIDVHGIELAREVAGKRGWASGLTLREGSCYNLADLFTPQSFDIIVATQVLKHVARIRRFMQQVVVVLKPGGEAFLIRLIGSHALIFAIRYG